jgi:acyl-CoA dehydrogenase
MTWPERYGGHGRSPLDRHVVIEELMAAGGPVAAHWISDRQTGPLLLRYGSDELRERLPPAMARGECYFPIGVSEPDSGSDLASLRGGTSEILRGVVARGLVGR